MVQDLTLPKISSYMRSIWLKFKNFFIDLNDRDCSVSFVTEVWEKLENKKHQNKIEELMAQVSGGSSSCWLEHS